MKKIFLTTFLIIVFSTSSFSQTESIFNFNKFDELFFDYFSLPDDSIIAKLITRDYCFYFEVQNNKVNLLTDTIPSEMFGFFNLINKNVSLLFNDADSGNYIFPITLRFKYKEDALTDTKFYLKDINKFFAYNKNRNSYFKVFEAQIFTLHYILIKN